jgi:hypothetical protein
VEWSGRMGNPSQEELISMGTKFTKLAYEYKMDGIYVDARMNCKLADTFFLASIAKSLYVISNEKGQRK